MAIRINELIIRAEIKRPLDVIHTDEVKEVPTMEKRVHSLLERTDSAKNKKRRER